MTAVTAPLANYVAGLTYAALPNAVTRRATALVFDQFGICVRARHEAGLCNSLVAGLEALGMTGGDAAVIGDTAGYSPPAAALFNGALGHSLDFDDTHAKGSIHPSAPILPAALAAAQMVGAGGRVAGREIITALVAGYEVQIRLSLALGPTDHYNRGFHPTATCGVFGAAAAAASIFNLTEAEVVSAFGLCGSQAAGSMQFLSDGAWNKPYHTGYASMGGLVAASLARQGFKGTAEPFEGKAGFLQGYAPSADFARATAGLGSDYETLEIAVKPYPSCRYGHAAMDAIIDLRKIHGIDYRDVQAVEVGLPRTGWQIIGDSDHDKQRPENYVAGQFSMPFVAAVALREGRMDWDHHAKHIEDQQTLALCQKVTTVVDPMAEAAFPANMSGVVRIKTTQGNYEQFVEVAKGEPSNFLTDDELRSKFDGLTDPYLSEPRRDKLAGQLMALHEVDDIGALLALSQADA